MNNSNSSSPASSRVTLKLKAGARKTKESKTPLIPPPQSKANLKPGAHWSDEYKERMQADMDALSSR